MHRKTDIVGQAMLGVERNKHLAEKIQIDKNEGETRQ